MKTKLRIKTLIMSDIHLGMADSKAVQAAHFLRHCVCDQIILNGDIIDAWALKTSGRSLAGVLAPERSPAAAFSPSLWRRCGTLLPRG